MGGPSKGPSNGARTPRHHRLWNSKRLKLVQQVAAWRLRASERARLPVVVEAAPSAARAIFGHEHPSSPTAKAIAIQHEEALSAMCHLSSTVAKAAVATALVLVGAEELAQGLATEVEAEMADVEEWDQEYGQHEGETNTEWVARLSREHGEYRSLCRSSMGSVYLHRWRLSTHCSTCASGSVGHRRCLGTTERRGRGLPCTSMSECWLAIEGGSTIRGSSGGESNTLDAKTAVDKATEAAPVEAA